MFRETLLNRLRGLRDDSSRLPSSAPAFPGVSDLVERFRQEAERVSTVVLDAREPSSVRVRLEEVLAATGADCLAWESGAVDGAVRASLSFSPPGPAAGYILLSRHHDGKVSEPVRLEVLPVNPEASEGTGRSDDWAGGRQVLAALPVSVGWARYGIAETGTLVESTGAGVGRILPILAPAHVALLRTSDLVTNQLELFQRMTPGTTGSAQVLMTGPSRTADIEKILILGVHGPRRLFVILT